MAKKTRKNVLLANISLALALLVSIFIAFIIYNFINYKKHYDENTKLVKIHLNSLENSYSLKILTLRASSLLKNWVFIDKDTAALSKKELLRILEREIPNLKQDFKYYVNRWGKEEKEVYFKAIISLDSLIAKYYNIIGMLNTYDAYKSASVMFEIYPKMVERGEIVMVTKRVLKNIDKLIEYEKNHFYEFLKMSEKAFNRFRTFSFIGTFVLIIITIIIYMFLRKRLLELQVLEELLEEISLGRLPDVNVKLRDDEIGQMAASISRLVEGLRKTSNFALKIGENKFDIDFQPLSKDDVLGNALLVMRDNLIKAQKEAELRRIENAQRSWSSQGLAEVNELIRNVGNDLDKLAQEVISHLVNYTGSAIGGIYILNKEDDFEEYLELKAFYAYDRHKYLKQKIKIGETLVGQCFYERQTIYMNDVPEDYVKIVSGLGSDKPKAILLVPLIVNEEAFGVVELASFEEYPQYKIEFVEKIGETVAAAISTVKINIQTQKLLQETHEKTERLVQQEIKARENIAKIEAKLKEVEEQLAEERKNKEELIKEKEKLQKELEDLKQKYTHIIENEQAKYQYLIRAINNTIAYYELNMNGDYTEANSKYLHLINAERDEVIGNKHSKFISRDFINSGSYKKIWDQLKEGKTVYTTVQYIINGKAKFITENFVPILDENKQLIKVIVFSQI